MYNQQYSPRLFLGPLFHRWCTVACPPGWFSTQSGEHINICYYAREADEGLTFAAAQRECQSIGGELVDFVTDTEAYYFNHLTEERGLRGSYWLDCSDREQEGHWLCRSDAHFWFNSTNRGYWRKKLENNFHVYRGSHLLKEEIAKAFCFT